ncbi:Sirohydrochlorin cobaltochelatase [Planctomycetales bacterium 10988]|nr:Sirohydrochlorin cobaltochelatase [Planctomycetales bacterium 10988]
MSSPVSPSPRSALLLIGHGTRDPAGVQEFLKVSRMVAELETERLVEPCFLELAEPSIEAAVEVLLKQEVQEITAIPLLLFAAGHAKEDIPEALMEATKSSPELQVRQTSPFFTHPKLLELSALRYREALERKGKADISPEATLIVFIGRGSKDPLAYDNMVAFAKARRELTPAGEIEVGFVALTEPKLAATLEWAATTNFRRVVVQPHFLFPGLLPIRVIEETEAIIASLPASIREQQEWIVTEILGAHPLLAEVIVGKAREGVRN